MLIGGFGDSDYLYSILKTWCAMSGDIQLLCPDNPQVAIVRGAVLRGIGGMAPSQKYCRRSYGVASLQMFREGIDPEGKAQWNKWDGTKRCFGRMDWLIGKVVCNKASICKDSSRFADFLQGRTDYHPYKASNQSLIDSYQDRRDEDDVHPL